MSYDRLIQVAEGVLLSPFDVVAIVNSQRIYGLGLGQYPENGTEVIYAGGARAFVPRVDPHVVLGALHRGLCAAEWARGGDW